MELPKDLREFVELLLSQKVEFLLVGGYALACHGVARFTEDIDFLVKRSPENAEKLETVLQQFGFGSIGISRNDFLESEQVIQLGRKPNRIDLLTSISGLEWDEAWNSRIPVTLSGLPCWAIGRTALITNKLASGRLQDLADASRLQAGEAPPE